MAPTTVPATLVMKLRKDVNANPDMPWAFSQQTGWMASPT